MPDSADMVAQMFDSLIQAEFDERIGARVARLQSLRGEVESLKGQIRELTDLQERVGSDPEVRSEYARKLLWTLAEGRFRQTSLAELAHRILELSEEPMHVADLWALMERLGKESSARNPQISLTAALLRDPRFENLGRNTFSLAEPQGRDD